VVRGPEVDLSWVDELAGPTHVAFVACHPLTGEPLGLARAVLQDDWAEIATTVVDRWQGQRIGTRLAQALAHELAERGTSVLVGTVAVDNPAAVALMRGLGARRVGPIESGTMEMRASLRAE
jgi:RimJ/RimL family protein N-acetyltransferase